MATVIDKDARRMCRFLVGKYVSNPNIRDDAEQEGLIAYYQTVERKQGSMDAESLKKYAYAAMAKQIITRAGRDYWTGSETSRNSWIDPLRRDHRRLTPLLYFDAPKPVGPGSEAESYESGDVFSCSGLSVEDQVELRGEIYRLLLPLSYDERMVVLAKAYYGMTYDEMADMLGATVNETTHRYRQAIKKIQKEITE